ncbi:DUF2934 domain-containing protein [Consotaella aegiceratis]|uniref:DUF2934 domain-containing protein n=1 Tax=Consotaella aegiceratis TaxID=3097961 RepID=UPI002F415FD8
MVIKDNAEAVRNRAYAIWEREGCPSGREHEHWAEAAREIDAEARLAEQEEVRREVVQPWSAGPSNEREAERMRRALWEPQPHCVELFPGEPRYGSDRQSIHARSSDRVAGRRSAA